MPSPDITRFVDLTIFDEDSSEIFNEILQAGRALIPEWTPRPGQIEVILAEIFANRTSEVVNAVNRIPGAVVETLLQLFGVFRNVGERASGSADFVFLSSGTIPAGTRFYYFDSNTNFSATYSTVDDVSAEGPGTVSVMLQSEVGGAVYNQNTNGNQIVPLVRIPILQSATFTQNTSGGTDTETDDDYFRRGVSTLGSYTSALVTDSQIQNYVVSNFSTVNRVRVYNRRRFFDRDTTSPAFSFHDGYTLVAVAGRMSHIDRVGEELTLRGESLVEISNALRSELPSTVELDVTSVDIVRVHARVTLSLSPGFVESQAAIEVEDRLQQFLNPNTWDWRGQIIPYSSLYAAVAGLDSVASISYLALSGEPVVGMDNVGSFRISGGTRASGDISITGLPSSVHGTTVDAGDRFYFTFVSNEGELEFLTFETTESFAVSGSGTVSGSVSIQSLENGSKFNDAANGGQVSGNLIRVEGGTGTVAAGGLSGGTVDREIYVPIASGDFVETDLVMKNLGTLPVFGNVVVSAG